MNTNDVFGKNGLGQMLQTPPPYAPIAQPDKPDFAQVGPPTYRPIPQALEGLRNVGAAWGSILRARGVIK